MGPVRSPSHAYEENLASIQVEYQRIISLDPTLFGPLLQQPQIEASV